MSFRSFLQRNDGRGLPAHLPLDEALLDFPDEPSERKFSDQEIRRPLQTTDLL